MLVLTQEKAISVAGWIQSALRNAGPEAGAPQAWHHTKENPTCAKENYGRCISKVPRSYWES